MYDLLAGYLRQLPDARIEDEDEETGEVRVRWKYHPHSLRATTATLLLEQGEEIREVQKLLGHRHVTTTQIYDKRRRGTKDSASHRLQF